MTKKILIVIVCFILLIPSVAIAQEENNDNNLIEAEKETKENEETKDLSRSTYLSSLSIDGYEIDFDKYQTIYTIEVSENVNELDIAAIAESESAKVTITGNKDVKNNNMITIEVSLDEEKENSKTYIINLNKIEKVKDEIVETNDDNIKITEKQKDIGIKILIGILIVIVVVFIIIKIRDKRIEKGINKF